MHSEHFTFAVTQVNWKINWSECLRLKTTITSRLLKKKKKYFLDITTYIQKLWRVSQRKANQLKTQIAPTTNDFAWGLLFTITSNTKWLWQRLIKTNGWFELIIQIETLSLRAISFCCEFMPWSWGSCFLLLIMKNIKQDGKEKEQIDQQTSAEITRNEWIDILIA